jgi:YD repeat-containing protein
MFIGKNLKQKLLVGCISFLSYSFCFGGWVAGSYGPKGIGDTAQEACEDLALNYCKVEGECDSPIEAKHVLATTEFGDSIDSEICIPFAEYASMYGAPFLACQLKWEGCTDLEPVGGFDTYPNSNYGSSCNNIGNPINASTGNKFYDIQDGSQKKLSLHRFYNSYEGKWRFSFTHKLIIESLEVEAQRADGQYILFNSVNGEWHALPPNQGVLRLTASIQPTENIQLTDSSYVFMLPDGRVETYDEVGRLLSILVANKPPIILAYDTNKITVAQNGSELVLTTNENNQVLQAVFSGGNVINYAYTDNNGISVLSTVTYADNVTRQHLYENTSYPAYITGITDENGHRISSVQYDSQGRATSSEKGPLDSGIERTKVQYNSDGTRTVTNALNKQSTYHFTKFNGEYKMTQVEGIASDNCAAANKNYTYDANGFMESKTDWKGNTTTYIHNDRGQELSRVEASGTPQARSIKTEWHSEFNLPIKISEPARETIMAYDANGRLLSRNITER